MSEDAKFDSFAECPNDDPCVGQQSRNVTTRRYRCIAELSNLRHRVDEQCYGGLIDHDCVP